jgi:hypothetical protein
MLFVLGKSIEANKIALFFASEMFVFSAINGCSREKRGPAGH